MGRKRRKSSQANQIALERRALLPCYLQEPLAHPHSSPLSSASPRRGLTSNMACGPGVEKRLQLWPPALDSWVSGSRSFHIRETSILGIPWLIVVGKDIISLRPTQGLSLFNSKMGTNSEQRHDLLTPVWLSLLTASEPMKDTLSHICVWWHLELGTVGVFLAGKWTYVTNQGFFIWRARGCRLTSTSLCSGDLIHPSRNWWHLTSPFSLWKSLRKEMGKGPLPFV